jgi:hypothetical protein
MLRYPEADRPGPASSICTPGAGAAYHPATRWPAPAPKLPRAPAARGYRARLGRRRSTNLRGASRRGRPLPAASDGTAAQVNPVEPGWRR